MKTQTMMKWLVAGLLLGAFGLAGCSEKKEEAQAPMPREIAQRAEEAAKEEAKVEQGTQAAAAATSFDAAAAYGTHCAACHPDGGNIINSQKTLQRASLEAHGITSPEDIVKVMRNPGQGMPAFGPEAIPDDQALAIARYVWETYK